MDGVWSLSQIGMKTAHSVANTPARSPAKETAVKGHQATSLQKLRITPNILVRLPENGQLSQVFRKLKGR